MSVSKFLFLFLIVVLSFSCSRKTDFEKYLLENTDSISGVQFLYTCINDTCETEFCYNKIRIKGTLLNLSKDTIKFINYTCQGEEFLFEYDTTLYLISPELWCQMYIPQKKIIAPGDSVKINSTLFPKDSSFRTVNNVAFRFMKINEDTISDFRNLNYVEIENRITDGTIKDFLIRGERR